MYPECACPRSNPRVHSPPQRTVCGSSIDLQGFARGHHTVHPPNTHIGGAQPNLCCAQDIQLSRKSVVGEAAAAASLQQQGPHPSPPPVHVGIAGHQQTGAAATNDNSRNNTTKTPHVITTKPTPHHTISTPQQQRAYAGLGLLLLTSHTTTPKNKNKNCLAAWLSEAESHQLQGQRGRCLLVLVARPRVGLSVVQEHPFGWVRFGSVWFRLVQFHPYVQTTNRGRKKRGKGRAETRQQHQHHPRLSIEGN